MKKYSKVNNLCGWASFLIAAIVFLMTIEPTASFWDCSEFIASSYKFEVGHPPGAPFFMLMAKFFTLFSPDKAHIAVMVNSMSALMSAGAVLFLFWTITYFAKKLVYTDESKDMTLGQMIVIMGSGFVGALAFTFSDSFWFSAVEGEVYATSAMFTALVFWLILKWERSVDKPHSDRWLVLMAYCVGLSIGVHLLNLLCLPAIVLVYYFKKNKETSTKGILIALGLSFMMIAILMFGIIPGFTTVGAGFELFFVNTLGFAYNTGSFVYLALLIGLIIWCIYETMSGKGNMIRAKISFFLATTISGVPFLGDSKFLLFLLLCGLLWFSFFYKKVDRRLLNTSMVSLLVVLLGYSSFAMLPIRSIANPPLDENSPENVFSLRDYLNRDQYGQAPLFYGRTFASSDVVRDDNDQPIESSRTTKYERVIKNSPSDPDQYYVISSTPEYELYNSMLFPRMYSSEKPHLEGYHNWGGVNDFTVAPTMIQNMQYFFTYQLNFMYFRYLMWNFSGRQNDKQGRGGIANGNWITGIPAFDQYVLRLGPQDNLPPDIAQNKGHNVYYMLPFLLGLLGICYQYSRGKKGEQQFWITFMLFFMTGIAIVLYLNQKPAEPRERDYAYVGSFYAFTIWIGLGVAGLWAVLQKIKSIKGTPAAILATLVTILIPIQMGSQNWDDHDRSGRTTMRDFGENYLMSCKPNAIIFTNGDNDTFPLWYLQEVENFRTDVRVCNLSYLQTDWYVDQMKLQAYESKPLPILSEKKRYAGEKGLYASILTRSQLEKAIAKDIEELRAQKKNPANYDLSYDTTAFKDTLSLDVAMKNLRANDSYIPKMPLSLNEKVRYIIPSNKLVMNIDTTKVNWSDLGTKPSSSMYIDLGNEDGVYRQGLMIMEMLNNINNDNWKRPIYFAVTAAGDLPVNLKNNFMLQGMTYRVVPGKLPKNRIDTDVTFDNMVNKFKWGGIANPKVYLDQTNMGLCLVSRQMFSSLIEALLNEGKNDKALIALNKCMEVLPMSTVPPGGECASFAAYYFQLGKQDKGNEILNAIENRANKTLNWYNRLDSAQINNSANDIAQTLLDLNEVTKMYFETGHFDLYKKDIARYFALSKFYYESGATDAGDIVLKILAQNSSERIRYYQNNPTLFQIEGNVLDSIKKYADKYNPKLFKS